MKTGTNTWLASRLVRHCVKSVQIQSFFWSVFGHFSRSEMKNGKATEQSRSGSEMVKSAGEPGIDMVKDLINQIIVEGYSIKECA